MSTECGSDGSDSPASCAVVRRWLREEADSVRREETERAVRKLATDREISGVERDVVERLGVRLTEAVLATPEMALESGDPAVAQSVADLFDLEPPAE